MAAPSGVAILLWYILITMPVSDFGKFCSKIIRSKSSCFRFSSKSFRSKFASLSNFSFASFTELIASNISSRSYSLSFFGVMRVGQLGQGFIGEAIFYCLTYGNLRADRALCLSEAHLPPILIVWALLVFAVAVRITGVLYFAVVRIHLLPRQLADVFIRAAEYEIVGFIIEIRTS